MRSIEQERWVGSSEVAAWVLVYRGGAVTCWLLKGGTPGAGGALMWANGVIGLKAGHGICVSSHLVKWII